MRQPFFATLAFGTFIFSCNQENNQELNLMVQGQQEPIPAGAFDYTAFDSTGRLIIQGWLMVDTHDSSNISGNWHISKVDDPDNLYPHMSDGELDGSFLDSLLQLNLNPDWSDNNVYLTGQFADSIFSGTWVWSTAWGISSEGTFQAIK